MFSFELHEKIYSFRTFCREWKRWKSFDAKRWVNIVVEETRLNPIFLPACFWLNVALYYYEQHFSYWWVQGIFLDFSAHVEAVESICLHQGSDCSLKTKNEKYHGDSTIQAATFHSWNPAFRIGCGDSSLSSYSLVIEYCHKRPIFLVTCINILEKQIISLV